jgi:hypothetical protein
MNNQPFPAAFAVANAPSTEDRPVFDDTVYGAQIAWEDQQQVEPIFEDEE